MKEFRVRWNLNGATIVKAESKEDAGFQFSNMPIAKVLEGGEKRVEWDEKDIEEMTD
jgi:hypothetical protein